MKIIEVNDIAAPELDVYARLTEPQLRNRLEPEKGIFIAESPKVIKLALSSGCEPVSFLMERKHIDGDASEILLRAPDAPVYTADRSVLEELTGYKLTRGVLCAMKRPRPRSVESIAGTASRIAVLEGIADSTNMGAIFRSAAALGVGAVALDNCCDPLLRRSVRVSMGTVFLVPWAHFAPGTDTVNCLRGLGFRTAAMALRDCSIPPDDARLRAEGRLAVFLGSEGDGLSDRTISRCDYTVKIPMSRDIDSLNVAAASAIIFWELCR